MLSLILSSRNLSKQQQNNLSNVLKRKEELSFSIKKYNLSHYFLSKSQFDVS